MCTSEFPIFCQLLNDIHLKAFGEPLRTFDQPKSRAMSWFIYHATGDAISYKSLYKYANAVLNQTSDVVNPTETTLGILCYFLQENPAAPAPKYTYWYQYRRAAMSRAGLAR